MTLMKDHMFITSTRHAVRCTTVIRHSVVSFPESLPAFALSTKQKTLAAPDFPASRRCRSTSDTRTGRSTPSLTIKQQLASRRETAQHMKVWGNTHCGSASTMDGCRSWGEGEGTILHGQRARIGAAIDESFVDIVNPAYVVPSARALQGRHVQSQKVMVTMRRVKKCRVGGKLAPRWPARQGG